MRLALLVLPWATALAQSSEPSSFVVVFDGSGSMWGPIEGTRQSKLVVARDGLRRALGGIAPQTRVGLAAYGHRRGDCSDVDVIRRAEPLDMDRILGPLERLNPKGRGPLTLALRESARSLSGEAGNRSLLLIHDDADNCQADLCAAAGELRAAGIKVHIVSLAPKPEDLAKMTCLAEVTGGRLFYVQNADQAAAAIEDAVGLASNNAALPPPAAAAAPQPLAPQGAGAEAASAPADGSPALSLRVLLADGNEPSGWPMHWTIVPDGSSGVPVFDGRAANPTIPLAPGRYRVEARSGAVAATQVVEVAGAGATIAKIVLNAGIVQVRTQWQKSGAPFGGMITIGEAEQARDATRDSLMKTPLVSFRGSETSVMLPAGYYVVLAEEGLVRAQRPIVVPAGSQGHVDVTLNGARIQLTASLRDGMGRLDAPVFSIEEDDPDAPGGRREIARSAAAEADFAVPPGTYHVIVRQDGLEAREVLAVGPGDAVRRTLTLSAGKLNLQSRLAGASQPVSDQVSYRIERLHPPGMQPITTGRPAPSFLLPGGRYRITGRYGAINARASQEIELKAGQVQQLALEYAAASVRLRLAGGAAQPSEPLWTIRDGTGRIVWATGQAEPILALQAGRYEIRVATQEKHTQRVVDLRAGETRSIEISLD